MRSSSRGATRIGVMLLRCVALAGLFVFFLGIERRTTSEVVHNSQVAVLVDVSQSMGLSENERHGRKRRDADRRRRGRVAESPLMATCGKRTM